MAIPSGGGTEVLKSTYMVGLDDTVRTFISTSSTQIATLISITFESDNGNTAETVSMYIDCGRDSVSGAAGAESFLIKTQSIGAYETFVFSDKVVLYGGDVLKAYATGGGDFDVVCSYILQDWT